MIVVNLLIHEDDRSVCYATAHSYFSEKSHTLDKYCTTLLRIKHVDVIVRLVSINTTVSRLSPHTLLYRLTLLIHLTFYSAILFNRLSFKSTYITLKINSFNPFIILLI